MKTGCTGLVLARRLVLATNSGWDGILGRGIACSARMIVNFGGEFVLREGGPLRLLKSLSRALLSSCAESFNCRWNNAAIPRRRGLFVNCGSEIYVWFRAVGFV